MMILILTWYFSQWYIFRFSSYNGAQWCYVENNIGYGYSTCEDQRRSVKFPGQTWSYHACVTPALYSSSCRYCQGRRNSQNSSSRNEVGSRRPTIRGPDPKAEGTDTGKVPTKRPGPTRPTPSRFQYRGRSSKYQYQGRLWEDSKHVKTKIVISPTIITYLYYQILLKWINEIQNCRDSNQSS